MLHLSELLKSYISMAIHFLFSLQFTVCRSKLAECNSLNFKEKRYGAYVNSCIILIVLGDTCFYFGLIIRFNERST